MKKNTFSIIFLILFILNLAYGLKKFEMENYYEIKASDIRIFNSVGLQLKKDETGKTFIGLGNEKCLEEVEFGIDFEEEKLNLNNYSLLYNNFIRNSYEKYAGNFSGKFVFSDHYIALKPNLNSIFYPGNEVGSFTIEFWLYPYKNYDYQYVVNYLGEDITDPEGKRYGFSIYTENGRLTFTFENFFFHSDKSKVKEVIKLSEEKPLILYKWEHHAISYDSKTGRLSIFRNGIEEKTIWLTENGKRGKSIFYPYVNPYLNSSLLIGKRGYFLLDNFKVLKEFKENYNLRKFYSEEAFFVSHVFKITENCFTIKEINLTGKYDNFSFIKLGYRISKDVFSPDDNKLQWVYINPRDYKLPLEFTEGKYIQFKLVFYPETVDNDIRVYSIGIKYVLDETPYVPQIVKTIPLDGGVEIYWMPSPEEDIEGYEIYYGHKSKNYICNDAEEGPSPIFVKKTTKGFELQKFKLSLMNEKPYFISIRTVDRNGHKSPYSQEVFVRPSTVFSENKFSVGR